MSEETIKAEKKNEGLIKDATELVLREFQLILTLLYLTMIGIGMLFNYFRYHNFNINIFEFADVLDFLIAPFQDKLIVLTSMIAIAFPSIFVVIDFLWQKHYPNTYSYSSFGWDKYAWYNKFRVILFSSMYLYLLFEVARGYGQFVHRSIDQKPEVTIEYVDGREVSGHKIGKIKGWIFLYQADHEVVAIPTSSVVSSIHYGKAEPKKKKRTIKTPIKETTIDSTKN